MAFSVFINFNGNCREAVEFYANVFNLESPKMMTYGETSPGVNSGLDEEELDKIMYTYLSIHGTEIRFCDIPKAMDYNKGDNISLVINSSDTNEIEDLFNKLKEGGTVGIAIQKTLWSGCYGNLTDKFGVNWELSHREATF